MPSASRADSSPLLLVSWEGGGNVPPMLALGRRLAARDRRVCVLAPPTLEPRVRAAGLEYVAFATEPSWSPRPGRAIEEDLDALFVRHLAGMELANELLAAVERTRPAALVVDGMALGALSAAETLPVPTAALVHTRYRFFAAERGAAVWEPELDALNTTRVDLGLEPISSTPGWSVRLWEHADLTIVASLQQLEGPQADPPSPRVRYVGPILDPRPDELTPELAAIARRRDRPLVVVSLSTTYMNHDGLAARIVAALNATRTRSVITLGHALDGSALTLSDGLVARWASHEELLPYADAVVTHAGLGTTLAALAAGAPLVCVPLGRDQPENATEVARLGAGIALDTDADAETIRDAITEVITTPSYRHAAQALARHATGLGRGELAADEVERLAA
jgi:MGT family glycosyltransferase